jgi:DNA-binding response OmpR family regulator
MRADSSTSGRILAVVTDLMLESRIREKARAMGYDVSVADTVQAVCEALDSAPPDLLVLDLQAEGLPWREAVAAAKEGADSPVPVLAYGQHTKPHLLRAARDAGCAMAVPRSQLMEEFPALIEQVRRQT